MRLNKRFTRRPIHEGALIHHIDRRSQCISIRYMERLAKAGIEPWGGRVGKAFDNTLAETSNGLGKIGAIRRQASLQNIDKVELATLSQFDWYNHHRLLGNIGNSPSSRRRGGIPCKLCPTRHGRLTRSPETNHLDSGRPGPVQMIAGLVLKQRNREVLGHPGTPAKRCAPLQAKLFRQHLRNSTPRGEHNT